MSTPADQPATRLSVVPVIIETSVGVIEVEVYPAHAPLAAANFLRYVTSGMDVIRRIQASQTNDREQLLAPVTIARIYRK